MYLHIIENPEGGCNNPLQRCSENASGGRGLKSTKVIPVFEELVSKTCYIHSDMLLICIIDFILQLKRFKTYVLFSYCGTLSFDVSSAICTKFWVEVSEWHAEVDIEVLRKKSTLRFQKLLALIRTGNFEFGHSL